LERLYVLESINEYKSHLMRYLPFPSGSKLVIVKNFIHTFTAKKKEMLSESITNWMGQIRQYCPTYSNGFLRIPYKGNSPQLLLDSFKMLPFVKQDKQRQFISANTPIIEGAIHYHQLEKGCWVFYSKTKNKTNICFEYVKDEKSREYLLLSQFKCS
jgi:hypothetical protein